MTEQNKGQKKPSRQKAFGLEIAFRKLSEMREAGDVEGVARILLRSSQARRVADPQKARRDGVPCFELSGEENEKLKELKQGQKDTHRGLKKERTRIRKEMGAEKALQRLLELRESGDLEELARYFLQNPHVAKVVIPEKARSFGLEPFILDPAEKEAVAALKKERKARKEVREQERREIEQEHQEREKETKRTKRKWLLSVRAKGPDFLARQLAAIPASWDDRLRMIELTKPEKEAITRIKARIQNSIFPRDVCARLGISEPELEDWTLEEKIPLLGRKHLSMVRSTWARVFDPEEIVQITTETVEEWRRQREEKIRGRRSQAASNALRGRRKPFWALGKLLEECSKDPERYHLTIVEALFPSRAHTFASENWEHFEVFAKSYQKARRPVVDNDTLAITIRRFEKIRDPESGLPYKSLAGMVIDRQSYRGLSSVEIEQVHTIDHQTGSRIRKEEYVLFKSLEQLLPELTMES